MSILEYFGFRPTLKSFTARLLRELPTQEGVDWIVDLDQKMLRHPGGLEVSLTNIFLEYSRSSASERGALIDKYAGLVLASTREVPDLWIEAAPNLYPALRSEFVEIPAEIRQRSEGPGYDPIIFPFSGDLRVRLMYDFGNSMAYVRGEKLKTWGQSPEAVLERARANLGRLETPQWFDIGHGVWQLKSEDSYEESFALLDSVIRALPFAATALFMPCNRGILLATDARSDDSIEAMLLEAERMMMEAPWPMSSALCRRTADGWEAVEAPASCANLAHGLDIRHRAEYYALQKESLDAWHEARHEDIFVATFTVMKIDEEWQSYCVWAEGVLGMLPVVDWVAVAPAEEQKDHIRVPWKDVMEICGPRLQPTRESPPRFLVDSFPDAAEWDRLVARKLPG